VLAHCQITVLRGNGPSYYIGYVSTFISLYQVDYSLISLLQLVRETTIPKNLQMTIRAAHSINGHLISKCALFSCVDS
jgi:hypothetical protein